MKTFFWTSVVWMLGLGAFWCAGERTSEGRDFWLQILPNQVKVSLTNAEANLPENLEGNSEQDQLSALLSGGNETMTGKNLTGEIETNTGDVVATGKLAAEPEFIVEVASNKEQKEDKTDSEIVPTSNPIDKKQIEALEARVEALEYHLLMLMQSLKQPQTQPVGIPMKYPVWNYSLQN